METSRKKYGFTGNEYKYEIKINVRASSKEMRKTIRSTPIREGIGFRCCQRSNRIKEIGKTKDGVYKQLFWIYGVLLNFGVNNFCYRKLMLWKNQFNFIANDINNIMTCVIKIQLNSLQKKSKRLKIVFHLFL